MKYCNDDEKTSNIKPYYNTKLITSPFPIKPGLLVDIRCHQGQLVSWLMKTEHV